MTTKPVGDGTVLWEPTESVMREANITKYVAWLQERKGLAFDGYNALWQWSVDNIEDFWASIWEYFKVKASKPYTKVLSEKKMPGCNWFPGAELNYAEHVFRNRTSSRPAILYQREDDPLIQVSWEELYQKVSSVAAMLRNMGVKQGDRIVAYAPNIPETAIALLASASIGAIWSSCSPDFGSRSVVDRFQQIEPKVLFATDGYKYSGKPFDRRSVVSELQQSLPSLERTVLMPSLQNHTAGSTTAGDVTLWADVLKEDGGHLEFTQVPFNHPLWVVYSSGTTGLPKALVQSQGGILIELLKFLSFHVDLKPDDRFFWFSTTGWIMWNILMGGLLHGSTIILFDGNPGYPDMDTLWKLAEKTRMTVFGTGAPFLHACLRMDLEPGKKYDLSDLRSVGSTGAPLSPEGFKWVYDAVKGDLHLGSTSGGTDVCTGFLGGCPVLPVRAGELQCRCLGVKAESYDEKGNSLIGEVGELVVTEPMPSMPLYLWNDPEDKRYAESYFDMYPGVWRHGDWIKFTPEGSAVISGRSDSTLKRMGVRMGSSEIYSAVEDLPEVRDSLIVGYETAAGGYFMPLFVVLEEGFQWDEGLKAKIRNKIRDSPVPPSRTPTRSSPCPISQGPSITKSWKSL